MNVNALWPEDSGPLEATLSLGDLGRALVARLDLLETRERTADGGFVQSPAVDAVRVATVWEACLVAGVFGPTSAASVRAEPIGGGARIEVVAPDPSSLPRAALRALVRAAGFTMVERLVVEVARRPGEGDALATLMDDGAATGRHPPPRQGHRAVATVRVQGDLDEALATVERAARTWHAAVQLPCFLGAEGRGPGYGDLAEVAPDVDDDAIAVVIAYPSLSGEALVALGHVVAAHDPRMQVHWG